MAGPATRSCSTHDLEVLPWWYDLAVKIFPVLWVNSNRLVKKNSDSDRYQKSDKYDQHDDYM